MNKIRIYFAAGTAIAGSALTAGALAASAASASPAAPPTCTAGNLGGGNLAIWVDADRGNGAAGTIFYPLSFTNVSGKTCTLHGYPGVSAVNSSGKQLGPAAGRDSAVAPKTVTLAPGATAHAVLAYSDVVTGNCPPAKKATAFELKVYPPGGTIAGHAFWPLLACTTSQPFMHVGVVQTGT